MPRVSVVITARNAAPYLSTAVESILAQSYRDLEVIVVDGGSTDGTVEIAERYGPPVRVLGGSPLTKSAGRNVGIRAATGEFIGLVDADDWWMPTKLARQVEYFEAAPACQWVYSDCLVFDERRGQVSAKWSTGNPLRAGRILEPLLFGCFVPSPTPLIRRGVFDVVGLYDETFVRHEPEDWDLWLRIAARFPAGVVHEPLAYLRAHSRSLTAMEDAKLAAEGALAVLDRALTRNPTLPEGVASAARTFWFVNFGRGLARRGRMSDARALFARGVIEQPLRLDVYAWWMATWVLAALWWPAARRRQIPQGQ